MWIVRSLGAPNIAERMEADLIQSFVDRIAEFRPQLVIFQAGAARLRAVAEGARTSAAEPL